MSVAEMETTDTGEDGKVATFEGRRTLRVSLQQNNKLTAPEHQ